MERIDCIWWVLRQELEPHLQLKPAPLANNIWQRVRHSELTGLGHIWAKVQWGTALHVLTSDRRGSSPKEWMHGPQEWHKFTTDTRVLLKKIHKTMWQKIKGKWEGIVKSHHHMRAQWLRESRVSRDGEVRWSKRAGFRGSFLWAQWTWGG